MYRRICLSCTQSGSGKAVRATRRGANSSAGHCSERLFIICIRAKPSHWLCLHCLRVVSPPSTWHLYSTAQISDTFPCQYSAAAAAFPKVERGKNDRDTLIQYGTNANQLGWSTENDILLDREPWIGY
ncbi:hypothetical protein FOIG_05840 [Fusarium odoratissimum NRRL 54006]|uniref:Uncharacterized protein n=2 Tax=Fusarium oxysporum species complex TaxID=171631 RepID=X0K2K8_FUSO5|nr:uncharacterized protein FOIG_05840 [Fusarium odoratissimum NRRL 54006]EXM02856.1 hypothetical protein FOIG_05840 [Fusarium odoratissimum NRRL 54006]TXC12190.1 hypothetical protein FocTR4_00007087 [Fusarium oxysporum f. sp. cubense]